MLKHNSLDKYSNDILVLFMSHTQIHIFLTNITLDPKTNKVGDCVILFILKYYHEHRKHFYIICQYIMIRVLSNTVVCMKYHILEVKPLGVSGNNCCPITSISTTILPNFPYMLLCQDFFNH